MQQFFALQTGPAELPDGEPAELTVESVGTLHLQSGRLAVAYTTLLDSPVVVPVPAGEHEVWLTTTRLDETYEYSMRREAYISVVFGSAESVTVEPAPIDLSKPEIASGAVIDGRGIDGLYGVETFDIGSVTLTDANEIFRGMPVDPATWWETVLSPGDGNGWFDRMDSETDGPLGTVNAVLPRSSGGANAITVITRAQQHYPILITRDAAGDPTGVHIDLLVIGDLSVQLEAFQGIDPNAHEYVREDEEAVLRASQDPVKKKRGLFGLFR